MTISPSTTITSISLVILMSLTMSFILTKKNLPKSVRTIPKGQVALTTMKMLSALSLMNVLLFYLKPESTTGNLAPWMKSKLNSMLSLSLDNNFMFFSATALIVTWSIMEFSIYYMASDPLGPKFFRLLIVFLLKMLILTSSKNLFLFFMGWEGVGFLSFLLMGWWATRQDAKTSALQAVIYNRMGDMGMMLLMSMALFTKNTWNMKGFLPQTSSNLEINVILFACLVAAIGKSAQFGLHPWLPAAMEGPTPVSALLHSSTMVVAGVFLLIRMTSMMEPSKAFLNMCLMTGSLTAIFAATSAFFQHDMKKMIAYSTTSQLGLMVVAMGFNQPLMAFFHMCTHAFFKAMLFLCSGSLMHSYKKEQDLRKMSKTNNTAPMTSACLLLGSIALMGIPFLSGFYSKDLMLETMALSPKKLISYILAMMATLLTAGYSFRMMSFCFLKMPSNTPAKPVKEENPNLYKPLIRLSMGAMVMGWLLSSHCFSLPMVMPLPSMKALPLMVTLVGASMSSTMIMYSKKSKTYTVSFLTKTWFFDRLSHPSLMKAFKTMALTSTTRTLDRGWSETSGGQGIFTTMNSASKTAQTAQTGYMKQYLLSIMTLIMMIFLVSMTI